jgi:hypothetical protein
MSDVPTLKCFVCNELKPKVEYSKKQLKKKGKRKCKTCGEASQAASGGGGESKTANERVQFMQRFAGEGNTTVKAVAADAVEQAQKKNTKANAPLLPSQDKYDLLLKWLSDGGAKFPKLYMRYYTVDYRGVHCKARLEPDEIILQVPLKLLMTSEVAKASKIGQTIKKSHLY